jgi:hypothetical protein
MGYIGLLLNAPYKIDSMVWMRLMILVSSFFARLFAFFYECSGLYELGIDLNKIDAKCG